MRIFIKIEYSIAVNTVNNPKPAINMKALQIESPSTIIAGVLLKKILTFSIIKNSKVKIFLRNISIPAAGKNNRNMIQVIIYIVIRIVNGIDAIIPIG